MKKFAIAFVAMLALAGAGGFYYYTHSDAKTQEKLKDDASQLGDTARRDAIKAEIATRSALLDKYKKFLAACDAHRQGHDMKLDGYDGFDYSKESEYKASANEEQKRVDDLNSRLNSVYDRK